MILTTILIVAAALALLYYRRRRSQWFRQVKQATEEVERLKLQLETVRYRTSRLREELSAADRQARLSHQLTLLGQFTAGFMHEFNNPLAIVTSRVEVLLEERKDDAALCADLQQMLQETRYMGNIARTLLQALRRERGGEVFTAPDPVETLRSALAAVRPSAEGRSVRIVEELAEVPRVNLPEHVVSEVIRGLLANALDALQGRDDGVVWMRLEPYRTAGSKVVARVEDNGPGVPAHIQPHLFEPFVSESRGREHLGLGLFLAASLLDMYDGRLRYETREGGGASFVVEMPPARFTRGQPYHWFVGGASS
jgi:two-component system C4-dicarboxylate transport sensor histidine kinase DctB